MYEAFISFKNLDADGRQTRDSQIAAELYQKLRQRGIEVFFSNEEVRRKSQSNYGRLIDDALESSRVLILIGTSPEFVKAECVEYEWRLFNNEIQSKRRNGQIITVLEGMSAGQLPIAIRHWESYSSSQLDNAVDMVCGILGKRWRTGNDPWPEPQPRHAGIGNVTVGSRVQFGSYPQSTNDPESITWRVLDIIDGRALMISDYLLDTHRFDASSNNWQTSELMEWLNSDFLNKAFTAQELRQLDVYAGDKVTLLSVEEVKKYFSDAEKEQKGWTTCPDRMAVPTAYARKNGAYINSDLGTGWWWLRSHGSSSGRADCVISYGSIDDGDNDVFDGGFCVRPVVLASLVAESYIETL